MLATPLVEKSASVTPSTPEEMPVTPTSASLTPDEHSMGITDDNESSGTNVEEVLEGVEKAPDHISTQYLHPPKTGKKAVTLLLSETERDIGEWYENHPLLYDKGHRDHPSSSI